MALIVRTSRIHRRGCYTTHRIRSGTRVIEYTGPRISVEEGDRRYDGKPVTYLFALKGGKRVIDGRGKARYINHSCDPNCETDEIKGRIWIIAIRDIEPGEELSYDYMLYDGEGEAPCHCGAKNCRGTLYSPAEVRRKKRAEERAKKKARGKQKKSRTRKKSRTKKSA